MLRAHVSRFATRALGSEGTSYPQEPPSRDRVRRRDCEPLVKKSVRVHANATVPAPYVLRYRARPSPRFDAARRTAPLIFRPIHGACLLQPRSSPRRAFDETGVFNLAGNRPFEFASLLRKGGQKFGDHLWAHQTGEHYQLHVSDTSYRASRQSGDIHIRYDDHFHRASHAVEAP